MEKDGRGWRRMAEDEERWQNADEEDRGQRRMAKDGEVLLRNRMEEVTDDRERWKSKQEKRTKEDEGKLKRRRMQEDEGG